MIRFRATNAASEIASLAAILIASTLLLCSLSPSSTLAAEERSFSADTSSTDISSTDASSSEGSASLETSAITHALTSAYLTTSIAIQEQQENLNLGASWHDWNPNPGDTINVSDASANTTVHITKAGTYRLTGSSTHVRVEVSAPEGQTITLMLADGLNIDPGILANIGVRSSAIDIAEHKNSTVELVSEAGANIYFGSYLSAPPIRKSGTQTKLVLKTADPANPGTITAHANTTSFSAGIGSVPYVIAELGTTGNIVIDNGTVKAQGGGRAAGIGGGWAGTADGITINGGTVEATGGGNGAGIGGGYATTVRNISINGGTVTAQGGHSDYAGAAGIGNGGANTTDFFNVENIRITGGTVNATAGTIPQGVGAAGIGAGGFSMVRGITISGGTVTAQGSADGSGIGGSDTSFATDITISGGDIKATGGQRAHVAGCGIGGQVGNSDDDSDASANITISGGRVEAKGNFGIGGAGSTSPLASHRKINISISGGTVFAEGAQSNSGIGFDDPDDLSITITGGSVRADCTIEPKGYGYGSNQLSTAHKTTVELEDAGEGVHITEVDDYYSLQDNNPSYRYGTNDLYTDKEGKLYLWYAHPTNSQSSPVDGVEAAGSDAGEHWSGSVNYGSEGILRKGSNIKIAQYLGEDDPDLRDGFAHRGSTSLEFDRTQHGIKPNEHWVSGYSLEKPVAGQPVTTMVVNSAGQFLSSVYYNGTQYTDDEGRWVYTGEVPVTLYTDWAWYSVRYGYDANVPSSASTHVSGVMRAKVLTHGNTTTLDECAYSLPGYRFVGWNTAADGSGTSYANKAEFNADTYGLNTNLVLYAQWEPLEYEVTLQVENPDSGAAETKTIAAKFDQPVELTWEGEIPSGSITAWEGRALGSFYPYGSTASNLCSVNEDGTLSGYTYNAVLSEHGMAYLSITEDKQGVDLGDTAIELTSNGTTFTPTFTALGNGLYAAEYIPEGMYSLSIEGWDTSGATLMVDSQGNGSAHLSFYSVEVNAQSIEDNAVSVWIDAGDGKKVQKAEHLRGNQTITIGASINKTEQAQGLCFDAWTAGGAEPENWNPTQAEQQVNVTDTATFTAYTKAAEYQVVFDPNCGDSEGTMPSQYQVYGESQSLNPNQFTRHGYDFAGWTTTKEWTGEETFTDQQEVLNLATENGAEVTLYAQWMPHAYYVQFNPNGASPSDLMPLQQFRYDQYDNTTTLSDCTYERTNYHFVGWNTKADGSGDSFEEGAIISYNLTEEEEGVVTLYAQWEHDSYTVNYDANGGIGSMEPQAILVGVKGQLNSCQFTREGYTFAGWNTSAHGDGTMYQAGAVLSEDLAQNGESVTLYAQWTPVHYTVHFDPNVPSSASTQISGTMNDQEMSFDQTTQLSWCEYVLLGYSFTGWNTALDGSGTSYADIQEVSNLATQDGDTVTLYAQWEAQTYTVNLYLDTTETTLLSSVKATFDSTFNLPAIDPNALPNNQALLGWETLAFGSFYADQASVINLCSFDNKGVLNPINLYAVVGEIGSSYIVMTNDETPVDLDDPQSDITLTDTQSGTELSGGFEKHASGIYKANNIPEGTYTVSISGWNTEGKTIEIDANGGGSLVLTYCTVESAAEDHAQAWIEASAADNPEQTNKIERVLAGSKITIGASVDEGYSFESWTTTGIAPDWQINPETGNPDQTLQEQIITINGKVLLEAHPVANRYQVIFDPNGGTGSMNPQDMLYDQSQNLFECSFVREGYTFAGWSTASDGSGATYANKQEVQNLTSEAGATITLYAQWSKNPEPGPGPDNPSDPDNPDSPNNPASETSNTLSKTGDETLPLILLLSIAMLAAASMALYAWKSGKQRK